MPSDFKVTLTGRRYLREDAVPSIFSWSKKDSPKRKSPRKRLLGKFNEAPSQNETQAEDDGEGAEMMVFLDEKGTAERNAAETGTRKPETQK